VASDTTPDAFVSHLECLNCYARPIGERLLYPPACPSYGAHTLTLVGRLAWHDPWWPLLTRVEVRDVDLW